MRNCVYVCLRVVLGMETQVPLRTRQVPTSKLHLQLYNHIFFAESRNP